MTDFSFSQFFSKYSFLSSFWNSFFSFLQNSLYRFFFLTTFLFFLSWGFPNPASAQRSIFSSFFPPSSSGASGSSDSDGASSSPGSPSSSKEYTIIQESLRQLSSSDKRAVSDAALSLGQYSYTEVSDHLIHVLKTEIVDPKINTFVIGNAIKSLNKIATKKNIQELETLRQQISFFITSNPSHPGVKSLNYLLAEFSEGLREISQRPDHLAQDLSSIAPQPENLLIKEKPSSSSGKSPSSQGARDSASPLPPYTFLKSFILKKSTDLSETGGTKEALSLFLTGTSHFLSDDIYTQMKTQEEFIIFGRDKETMEALDVLVREKGRNPILVGPRGAGKTTIVQKIAQTILENQIPPHPVFQNELGGAYIVETTPARISRIAKSNDSTAQASALERYFDAVLDIESQFDIKIILFIDELHTLSSSQIEAMKPYLDSRVRAIKLIGASTSVEYQNAFKHNPAIQRRFDPIGVSEQSRDDVLKILARSELPRIKKRYHFDFTSTALEVIVDHAQKVYPDTSLVDASAKMLMTISANRSRQYTDLNSLPSLEKPHTLEEQFVYEFIQKKLGYPVNPLDVRSLKVYEQNLLKDLNQEILGQEKMVADVTDEWIRLLKHNNKGVRSILILGPTGVGKSLLGRIFAQKVFHSEKAFLEVDGNQFKEGNFSNNTFFGAPNGVRSSEQTAGILFDYLDDPGKGKFGGIILINEAERAHTDFWEKMMELMDTGRAVGGDGKERYLNRHLIILTSNRGDNQLYPHTMEHWTPSEYQAHRDSLTEDRLKNIFKEAISGEDTFRLPDAILARIDKYTAAEPITEHKVQSIALQKAQKFIKEVESLFKIRIDLNPDLPREIAKVSYQKGFGARPVEKKVTHLLEMIIDQYLANHETHPEEKITLTFTEKKGYPEVEIQGAKGRETLVIPISVKQDLLSNQELLSRLDDLDTELKKRVFGQDDMINRLKDAVIAHQATESKRPLSLFTVGTTGTGKTETAKALAQALYRSDSRVLVLDMGRMIYDGEFNNIFGAPAGHVGSKEERVFEQFLRQNPQGGVIVFDEISNMGGKDPAQKQALFKKLYSIFEEGTWLSPATNKTYSLSKYTIINTGNDLEGLLQGTSTDDIRLAIWEKYKSSAQVRALLLKAGVPEAFLGRMADIILMKPLLKSEVLLITSKILEEQTRSFREKQVHIHFEESFVKDISHIFFTQDQGARSIRNLVEFRVKSALTQLVIKAKGIQNLHNKTIKLSLQDNKVQRTFIRPSDPERKVTLTAQVHDEKNPFIVTLDATEFASKTILQNKKDVLMTAYHEAGHAVVNKPSITGESVAFITVIGTDNTLGYARYEEIKGVNSNNVTEEEVVMRMARLLAGQLSENLAGFKSNSGWSGDLKKARSLASDAILKWGLIPGMISIPLNEKGEPKLVGFKAMQFEKEVQTLFDKAQNLATEILKEQWPLVRATVHELYHHGEITGQRFSEIKQQFESPSKFLYKGYRTDKLTNKGNTDDAGNTDGVTNRKRGSSSTDDVTNRETVTMDLSITSTSSFSPHCRTLFQKEP
jgi:ATP-dependent Clp protease ATP-binding subunit ClpC